MTKIKLAALAIISICTSVHAQDTTRTSFLDEVIITANKYPKKQTETGKVITIIGREQLEKSSGRTLPELLNTVAGTTILGANNNLGTNQTVSVRGSSAGNTLILIDGIPVNDPSVITNYYDLNFFDINQIERIEILKGGQSTLYGSDAVAGVINIIMKKATIRPVEGNATITGGSFGTIGANAGVRGQTGKSFYSLQYGYLHSEGFSSAYDSIGNKDFDDDGFDRHSITGTWRTYLTNKLQANVFGQFSHYRAELDASSFTDERDYHATNVSYFGGAGLSYELGKGLIQANYRYNHVRRSYFDDSIYKSSPFVNFFKHPYNKKHFRMKMLLSFQNKTAKEKRV